MRNLISRFLIILTLLFLVGSTNIYSQGLNHSFLVGYTQGLDTNVISHRGQLEFDSNSVNVIPKNFKMPFRAAQANISDENGNLLMVTNGCWIADASGDTMQNGGGLNPGSFTTTWCDATTGQPTPNMGVFLPYPGDSTKYILFHQTGNDTLNYMSSELYYSVIDMNLNGGLGAVTQKNVILIQDILNPGLAACKHANGRDWWITILKVSTDTVYKILLTPQGISSITKQSLGFPSHGYYGGQTQFSPDGNKFAYYPAFGFGSVVHNEIRVSDFDRCTGMFNNSRRMVFIDSITGAGLSFSPNSQYLYYDTFKKIYQLNTDTINIGASLDTVASYDGYAYPYNFMQTDFWDMYLAANGKIYITSGNGVIDLHCISAPDSEGIACNVLQHSLRLPCYSGRGNVYHPNYYLGPVLGSICDSLAHVGLQEHLQEVQNFNISPNPIHGGQLRITYLLPQNLSGIFEIYDLNGKLLYSLQLPPWSSLQYISLPFFDSGIYQCCIKSGFSIATKKLVVIK